MFNGLAAAERAQFVPLPLLVHLKVGEWGGGGDRCSFPRREVRAFENFPLYVDTSLSKTS